MDFELPDVELTTCTVEVLGLDTRCGAPVRLIRIERPDLLLTIRCELGHKVRGTMLELFSWWDLVVPALFFLGIRDYRELERMTRDYLHFVRTAAAGGKAINTAGYDRQLREWAARHPVVPFQVWVIAREHWGAFRKPHPDLAPE